MSRNSLPAIAIDLTVVLVTLVEVVGVDKGDQNVPCAFSGCQAFVVMSQPTRVQQKVALGQVCDRAVLPVNKLRWCFFSLNVMSKILFKFYKP